MLKAVSELDKLRGLSGARFVSPKIKQLRDLSKMPLTSPALIKRYHSLLLYLLAYPENRTLFKLARGELKRVCRAASSIAHGRDGRLASQLTDSGISGTPIECTYTLGALRWLACNCTKDVELIWDGCNSEKYDEFLKTFIPRAEWDGMESGGLISKDWTAKATGNKDRSSLSWLVQEARRCAVSEHVVDQLLEAAELSVRWWLNSSTASISFARFPKSLVFYHRKLLRDGLDLQAEIRKPMKKPTALSSVQKKKLCDVIKTSLFSRHRETDPSTYMNPKELVLFRLDRGFQLAIFGMIPERRLPIESYFGYLMAKNGIPVSYGGGWVFLERGEIGVNIFDPFRGGESVFLFSQILRAYHQYFGVRKFIVRPAQFGDDNSEGLLSGAFWFYYKLGFRPVNERGCAIAAKEAAKKQRNRNYRTPVPLLRKLARSNLELVIEKLPGSRMAPELACVSLGISSFIGRLFAGDRGKAERWAFSKIVSELNIPQYVKWPNYERAWLKNLALLFAPCAEFADWSSEEKRDFIKLLRSKGAGNERRYTLLLQKHPRALEVLQKTALLAVR